MFFGGAATLDDSSGLADKGVIASPVAAAWGAAPSTPELSIGGGSPSRPLLPPPSLVASSGGTIPAAWLSPRKGQLVLDVDASSSSGSGGEEGDGGEQPTYRLQPQTLLPTAQQAHPSQRAVPGLPQLAAVFEARAGGAAAVGPAGLFASPGSRAAAAATATTSANRAASAVASPRDYSLQSQLSPAPGMGAGGAAFTPGAAVLPSQLSPRLEGGEAAGLFSHSPSPASPPRQLGPLFPLQPQSASEPAMSAMRAAAKPLQPVPPPLPPTSQRPPPPPAPPATAPTLPSRSARSWAATRAASGMPESCASSSMCLLQPLVASNKLS